MPPVLNTHPMLEEALGSGETSRSFHINETGYFFVTMTGTFSSQTVTMQMSPSGAAADYVTYTVDVSGTPTAQTFTVTNLNQTVAYLSNSQHFRFVCSSGGSPDIDIFVTGKHVHYDPS